MAPPTLILGAGLMNNDPSNLENNLEIIQAARELGIKTLDTSRLYANGGSESLLGAQGLSTEFEITTKNSMALSPFGSSAEGVIKCWEASEEALKTPHVKNYLLHIPDDSVPIASTLEGINSLHQAGHFTNFGLSNFSAEQVSECYSVAKSKNYILPTVFQSVYNIVHRKNETTLFPTLRQLGFSIQAYSALASGFLVKTPEYVASGQGLFDGSTVHGKIMREMYGRPSYLEALGLYTALAKEAGLKPAGLAYRWIVWNSALREGDSVVLGASSASQLRETVAEIEKGPLEGWVVGRLDALWKGIEDEAPGDNFATWKKMMKAGMA